MRTGTVLKRARRHREEHTIRYQIYAPNGSAGETFWPFNLREILQQMKKIKLNQDEQEMMKGIARNEFVPVTGKELNDVADAIAAINPIFPR